MKPNAIRHHHPEPARMRALLALAGIPIATAALKTGVSRRTLERYLSDKAIGNGDVMPYPLQFTLEALCLPLSRARKVKKGAVSYHTEAD